MLHRMIGQIKVSSDQFGCVCGVFLYIVKVFSESVAEAGVPVSPIYDFLQRVLAIDT